MKWPDKVTIKEVGPRDGLQNEKEIVSAEEKIEWIDALSQTGLSYIEITSFVNPNWVPQLSDAEVVAKGIKRNPAVTYGALVPNMRGLETALEADIDEVSVFMSASETHNRKNINKSIDQTFPVLQETINGALAAGKSLRGYVSTIFGCPYEGKVPIEQVFMVCDRLFDMGIGELSLGDTTGIANPRQVEEVLDLALKRYDRNKIALHFHDTRGMAMANVLKALDYGITSFDSALGGIGGCPYAPGASGNVATDDLVYMLEDMGISTKINQAKLLDAAVRIQQSLGKKLPSHQMAVYSEQLKGV
ncbi:hydroxymethylglutaryl-CoA lyase [Peribacillus glennii]|uniref:Hydroxymethylglutaryl-CoA lyase n=1 Tax=Peribacillus glennii TaxID=2303991 RepID=A0A372L7I5_9BACI|nr:hydroxymethylglutaryl-CoA lyase [Peribacillus glennii]RFU60579.1 hydroxymethylglutaryl-CoA lyase [Peribacillus glennii]